MSRSADPTQHMPLTTPWTDQVDPKLPWPEYPRPQMVRERWLNLNGPWDYAISGLKDPQPVKFTGQILVPFPLESALSGVERPLQPEEQLWYRRSFTLPAGWAGSRILLHFGAVDWACQIWVNDVIIGEHTGGYDPFSLDITGALRPGENELVVAVIDPTDLPAHSTRQAGPQTGIHLVHPHLRHLADGLAGTRPGGRHCCPQTHPRSGRFHTDHCCPTQRLSGGSNSLCTGFGQRQADCGRPFGRRHPP